MSSPTSYEKSLLKRERSYRSVRLGAAFILIILAFGYLVRILAGEISQGVDPYSYVAMGLFAWVWDVSHLRIRHIETIKHHIGSEEQQDIKELNR